MRKKSLGFAMSFLLLLGLCGNVWATNDTTGDGLVPDVDILSASVVTYEKPSVDEPPDYAELCIKMNGGHLPAVIIWDMDVDNDPTTGGKTIVTGIPSEGCGGDFCKEGEGFDLYVLLTLRSQGIGGPSHCTGCKGAGIPCGTRGAEASCTEATCYELGVDQCGIGDPGCYELGEECSNCAGEPGHHYYPMANVCGFTGKDCESPTVKGEYHVAWGQNPQFRGNILLPKAYSLLENQDVCVTIPWSTVVERVWFSILESTDPRASLFDFSYAVNNPPKFQVAAYFDEDFADENDLMTFTDTGVLLDVSDWMPDTDRVADGEYNPRRGPCLSEEIYGEHSEEAEHLRDFRDSVLSQTLVGKEIIRLYYQWSPAIVKTMEKDKELKKEVKGLIDGILPLITKKVE